MCVNDRPNVIELSGCEWEMRNGAVLVIHWFLLHERL